MKTKREAQIKRKTNEVDIFGRFVLDGEGQQSISLGKGFDSLTHMLSLLTFHGFFDLEIKANGDLSHHIIEDIGIALGDAFRLALGDPLSISRYGFGSAPMDEVLVNVSVDISGRPLLLEENVTFSEKSLDLSPGEMRNFLKSFVEHARITVHVRTPVSGSPDVRTVADDHHYFEALFKSLAIALDNASKIDERRKGVPSTKGVIDL